MIKITGLGDYIPDLDFWIFMGFRIQEASIDLKVVGDRAEAVGVVRLLNRIDKFQSKPISATRSKAQLPVLEGAGEEWGQVIYL